MCGPGTATLERDAPRRRGPGHTGWVTASDQQLAIERLSREHGAILLAWIRRRTTDDRDAEEILADTLYRAWKHADQYDPDKGPSRAWLFGIARNAAIDHHRRRRRHDGAVDLDAVAEPGAEDTSLEQLVERSGVRSALDVLNPDQQVAVVGAYFQGLTVAEIAEREGIPPGTVKSRLFYGLKTMRDHLTRAEGVT